MDSDAVRDAITRNGRIVTVEDHNIINGLGSAVSEVIAEEGKGQLIRIGIRDNFGESAPYERLLAKNGITVNDIMDACKKLMGK